MRLIAAGAARAAYYDRNPSTIVDSGNTSVSENTVNAQLLTYTVPVARKAILATLAGQVTCEIAATTGDTTLRAWCATSITPSGGSAHGSAMAELNSASMAPGDRQAFVVGSGQVLNAGDQFEMRYGFSGSAGGVGVVHATQQYSATEFDA